MVTLTGGISNTGGSGASEGTGLAGSGTGTGANLGAGTPTADLGAGGTGLQGLATDGSVPELTITDGGLPEATVSEEPLSEESSDSDSNSGRHPAARILVDMHSCPMVTALVPHVGGPVSLTCSVNVITCGSLQARVTDTCICVGPPDMIITGSSGVYVNGLPAARQTDKTAHGGVILTGCVTVLIGETGTAAPTKDSTTKKGRLDDAEVVLIPLTAVSSESGLPDGSRQAEILQQAASNGTAFVEPCRPNPGAVA